MTARCHFCEKPNKSDRLTQIMHEGKPVWTCHYHGMQFHQQPKKPKPTPQANQQAMW